MTADKYAGIINLPRHVSGKHPPMPGSARAAQFASFAALGGYEEAIETETEKAALQASPRLTTVEESEINR